MTPFISAPGWLITAVGTFTVFTMLLAVCNTVGAMYLQLGRGNIIYTLMITITTDLFFMGISDTVESINNNCGKSFLAEVVGSLPSAAAVFTALVLAAANWFMLYMLIHRRRNYLNANTIKCTVDGMDDGICFFNGKGEMLLVNVQMNKISSELFGTEIMNGQLFWKNILSGDYRSGKLLKKETSVFIETTDKRVWNMRMTVQTLHKAPVYSVTAYDVSEQSRLYREVRKKNAILENVNQRLKDYNKAIKQVVADKETLAVKVRVHDDLGRVLLAARNVLSKPESNRSDRKELLNMWDDAVSVMKNEAKPTVHKDALDLLYQAAKSVHVTIETDGEIPEEHRSRKLIIAAAHECLTNTVKHAKGDRLYIKITDHGLYTEAQYLNNGIPPYEPIKESGGLANLRKTVEKAGGSMNIEMEPRFMLIVTVPKGEDIVWKK